MSSRDALSFLFQLQSHGIQPGLHRIRWMMDRLGHPERRLPSVHLAGTNGKGSTASMMAQALREAGYRVGLYTSPHLIDFSERIQINGVPIPEATLIELTERLRRLFSKDPSVHYTFFEFTTALAFLYFAQAEVDWLVAEVGLGGRFDATNVLSPSVTVLTPVDYDHEAYLGDTLSLIAAEKAGIIKPRVPVVSGPQHPEALSVIEKTAEARGASLIRYGREFVGEGDDPSECAFRGQESVPLRCPMPGRHQVDNAVLATAALLTLRDQGVSLSTEAIRRGIGAVRLAGRLETVQEAPLILLDGAHNPAGAAALAQAIGRIKPSRSGRSCLIFGVMGDKKVAAMFHPLLPLFDEAIFTRPGLPRAADPASLIAFARFYPCAVTVQPRVSHAISGALETLRPNDLLCITGSLYTVGEAKASLSGLTVSPLRG